MSSPPVFPLLPEEEIFLKTIGSSKRQAEFTLGRRCVHQALSKFKLESAPVLRNPETREPCWPESVRGSITHSGKIAAAAVGWTKDISGIGIDLESFSREIDFNISRHVCVETELIRLKSLPAEQAKRDLRIIFSAKESIFKCLFPISQTYLYFKDAKITINEDNAEFSFVLSKACSGITEVGFQHSGKFSIKDNMLLTSIFI
ncbi:MAG: 4'-phosphopantetheinyl transferase superfamily protein [SAR324 cluster bacterium]|nr:4'-phosphopantetheinyl transferase superfamily protein [SAR324 cluster bacterium]